MPPTAAQERPNFVHGAAGRKEHCEQLCPMALVLDINLRNSLLLEILRAAIISVERLSLVVEVIKENVVIVGGKQTHRLVAVCYEDDVP